MTSHKESISTNGAVDAFVSRITCAVTAVKVAHTMSCAHQGGLHRHTSSQVSYTAFATTKFVHKLVIAPGDGMHGLELVQAGNQK